MYEWGSSREIYDACRTSQDVIDNKAIQEYILGVDADSSSSRGGCEDPSAGECRSPWKGYGIGPSCMILKDSDFRIDPTTLTHPGRARRQLATRTFVAAPNLAPGECFAEVEARLQTGYLSTLQKQCALAPNAKDRTRRNLGEVSYDRFVPCVTMPAVSHIVPKWTPGGANSREIALSASFRKEVARQGSSPAAVPKGFAEANPNWDGAPSSASAAAASASKDDARWLRLRKLVDR
jgi:hypothetical protein